MPNVMLGKEGGKRYDAEVTGRRTLFQSRQFFVPDPCVQQIILGTECSTTVPHRK